MLKLSLILSMMLVIAPALCQEILDNRPVKLQKKDRPVNFHPDGAVDTEGEDHFGSLESIFIHGGFHTEFYNNVQTDSRGSLRKLDWAPTLGTGLSYPLTPSWRFLPEVNWVLPKTTDNSHIIKNIFMIRADFGYDVIDWFRLRAGTSLMWLNQHGTGGKAELDNGNGKSTFYYPDENRSSLNNTLDLGAEILLGSWALRLQTYTYALFKEERRQLSYTLFLSYYWKQ